VCDVTCPLNSPRNQRHAHLLGANPDQSTLMIGAGVFGSAGAPCAADDPGEGGEAAAGQ
jgi:hypothetical protein